MRIALDVLMDLLNANGNTSLRVLCKIVHAPEQCKRTTTIINLFAEKREGREQAEKHNSSRLTPTKPQTAPPDEDVPDRDVQIRAFVDAVLRKIAPL